MEQQQAFVFELTPDGAQQRLMRRFSGACRFIFNKALASQKARFEQGEKKLGYAGLCRQLTQWRHSVETPWLMEAPIHPLQQALKDLERAYANFFARRAGLPNFRRKGQSERFRYPDPKQIRLDQGNGRIFVPKLGWLRYRKSREVPGELRNVTISQRCGKWLVSIQTRREVEVPVAQGQAVGIDLGVVRFATLSDGSFLEPLNSFRRRETALRKAQQAMSRKVRFSRNWRKAARRVRRIHGRIGNTRRDFLHKATSTICKNHAVVFVEDLQVGNLSRSAAGTVDAPGSNVRAKSGLNKALLGLVRVPPATGIQAPVERWPAHRRAAAEHQPDLSGLRPRVEGQPPDPGAVRLRAVRLRAKRRPRRRDQHTQGWASPQRL